MYVLARGGGGGGRGYGGGGVVLTQRLRGSGKGDADNDVRRKRSNNTHTRQSASDVARYLSSILIELSSRFHHTNSLETVLQVVVVGWLLHVLGTWLYISGTDLLSQVYVLPH